MKTLGVLLLVLLLAESGLALTGWAFLGPAAFPGPFLGVNQVLGGCGLILLAFWVAGNWMGPPKK